MNKTYIDANIFLRYFLEDIPGKAQEAQDLFNDAVNGKYTLITSHLVIAEVIWTLESFYEKPKQKIAAIIESIINTPNLYIEDSVIIKNALEDYTRKNVDFIDAYSASYMRLNKITKVKTFDKKHFKRFLDLEII